MTQQPSISLTMAILININIMMGAGIFINTNVLAQRAGILGAFGYVIVGVLMFPLVLCIAQLLERFPSGSFYRYASQLHPLVGFISAWAYFTSKLASATLIIHVAVTLIQQIIPAFAVVNPLYADAGIIALFVLLNMNNIRTGTLIQTVFIAFKSIPIFFAILASAYCIFGGTSSSNIVAIPSGLPGLLPLAVYAIIGFEAACSLSNQIKNARVNGPRAIIISYSAVILLAALYQFLFYTAVGNALASAVDYRSVFPLLVQQCFGCLHQFQQSIIALLHLGIAASALGGSYGMLFSNAWNLYILGEHRHTFFPRLVTQLNKNAIPWICVLTEGLLCFMYLFISKGTQIPLQQIAALGSVTVYCLSSCALWYLRYQEKRSVLLASCAIANCAILLFTCINNLIRNGAHSMILYSCLMIFGVCMFAITYRSSRTSAA